MSLNGDCDPYIINLRFFEIEAQRILEHALPDFRTTVAHVTEGAKSISGWLWRRYLEARSCPRSPQGYMRALLLVKNEFRTKCEQQSSTSPKNENDERDQYIYDSRVKQVPYKRIIAEIKRNNSWDYIDSHQGVKRAADRFAERQGLPKPPQGKRGRPRKN